MTACCTVARRSRDARNASAPPCAGGSPASSARCATTASPSASPRPATRWRSSPRRRRRARRSLQPAFRALFSATRSDWQRFDEIFDAFWRGRGVRRMRRSSGIAERRAGATPPARRGRRAGRADAGAPDHVERRSGGRRRHRRRPAAGAKAPRAPSSSPSADMRHIVDPDEMSRRPMRWPRGWRERCGRGSSGASEARPARPPPRSPPHHPPQHLPRRHADRSRLAPAQDEAAPPRRPARRVRLDEPLHRLLRPLPARRGRRFPRGGGLRLPHPARPCLAVAARPRRRARRRPAVADGAGHRRRHADRREPRHLQSLARGARHQFAHRA